MIFLQKVKVANEEYLSSENEEEKEERDQEKDKEQMMKALSEMKLDADQHLNEAAGESNENFEKRFYKYFVRV